MLYAYYALSDDKSFLVMNGDDVLKLYTFSWLKCIPKESAPKKTVSASNGNSSQPGGAPQGEQKPKVTIAI